MPNFLHFESEIFPLRNRFPIWVTGLEAWQELSEIIETDDIYQIRRAIQRLQEVTKPSPPPCPRLFISHRKVDEKLALRIGKLALQEGFEIWIDVLDRNLQGLKSSQRRAGNYLAPLAIAGIIEVALLNCTHLIATVTYNTAGSFWVPYEFGRVKDRLVSSRQASSWIDPSTNTPFAVGEYLHLCPIHGSENDIELWLRAEMQKYQRGKQVNAITNCKNATNPDLSNAASRLPGG